MNREITILLIVLWSNLIGFGIGWHYGDINGVRMAHAENDIRVCGARPRPTP